MQCSWKAVILLALASIAIQYTAIRTLTSKPFQLCPLPSPQNCGLGGQETDPPFERGGAGAGAGCEDYNYFSANASRKTHILVLATTRSGSSFVGQLLNQHQEVFYLFEPLYHVQTTLIPRLSHSRNAADRRVMLGASRDLLRSLYGCDLYFLESYIKPSACQPHHRQALPAGGQPGTVPAARLRRLRPGGCQRGGRATA